MRSILKIVFVSLCTCFNITNVCSQKIVFSYNESGHAIQPNYSKIEIVIERTRRYCQIDVFTDSSGIHDLAEVAVWKKALAASKTKEDSLKLVKNAPKDKTLRKKYELTIEEFENIEKAITSIDSSKMFENMQMFFRDGYSCEIEYGTYSNSIKYKLHSPGLKGKKRSPNFSKACRLILEVAKIKPRKVL